MVNNSNHYQNQIDTVKQRMGQRAVTAARYGLMVPAALAADHRDDAKTVGGLSAQYASKALDESFSRDEVLGKTRQHRRLAWLEFEGARNLESVLIKNLPERLNPANRAQRV